MRDIAYDWNDAVHVMKGSEVVAGQAIGSLVTMLPDRRTVKERLLDTMARAAFRPWPTEAKEMPVWFHVTRIIVPVPCLGASPHNTFDLRDFANKMRGDRAQLCRDCMNYVRSRRHEKRRQKRAHAKKGSA